MLASITASGPRNSPSLGYSWNFSYEQPSGSNTALGDGSLTEVQFPQGGYLGWAYSNFTYITSRIMEEVSTRYLQNAAGGSQSTQKTYTLARPSADANNGTITVHSGMTLQDPTGVQKSWSFYCTNAGSYTPCPSNQLPSPSSFTAEIGLISQLQEISGSATPRTRVYTWAQDTAGPSGGPGNAYVASLQTTLDKGRSYAESTTTSQTLDNYGNPTTVTITDYNGQSRTYTNVYAYTQNSLPYSQYPSFYLFNRLLTSNLTSSVGPNVTLVSNTYDGGALSSPQGVPLEWDISYGTGVTARGNLTRRVTPGQTINTAYDTTGAVIEQDDNNGHSVSISTSSLTNYMLPDTLNPNASGGLVTQASYNSVNLAPSSVAGPAQGPYNPGGGTMGNTTGTASYTDYDAYGRVDYTLAPSQTSGSAAGAETTYTYSYALPWTTNANTPNSIQGNSHWTTTTLDGLGRTAGVQTGYGTGSGSTALSEVDTAYAPSSCSPLGMTSSQSEPYQPPNSAPPATSYYYDALGRTTSVVLADGSTTQYIYYGNSTTVIDPTLKWKQYANDAFGNLITVVEPDPAATTMASPVPPTAYPMTVSSLPQNTVLTTYTYDALNHLLSVSMPRSAGTQTRTFSYYSSTQLLQCATNPENGTVNYSYNADGTLASKQYGACGSPNLNKETYTYDAYQRLTNIHRLPNGGSEDTTQLQTFTYDTLNGVSYLGMLTSATFASMVGPNELTFQNQYTYTAAGNVLTKTLYLTSANHESENQAAGSVGVTYTYDNQGALITITPSLAPTLTYSLDAMERPNGLTNSNNTTWVPSSSVSYNAANQLLAATFPGGQQTWTYNNLMQMASQTIQGYAINYNYTSGANNGQVASIQDFVAGATINYTYDSLKRLASATTARRTNNWSDTFTYDEFGNVTGMTETGGAPSLSVGVNWQTNQITPTGIQYDSYGNVTQASSSSANLGYDVANRMVSVGGTQIYAYDNPNRRVYYDNASAGQENIYLFGADGAKLATYTIGVTNAAITFTLQSQNLYFAGQLIRAEDHAVEADRLGSVRWSNTGLHSYYPYGVEYTATANDTEKFATYTRDSLTGLDYAANRYYSSIWGRFMIPDPSGGSVNQGDPQSWNRYAYTKNDPINRNDPTGLFISAEDCIGNPDACDAYDWGQPGDLWGAPDAPIGPNGLPCGWGYGTACGIYPGNGCVEAPLGPGYAPTPPDPTPMPCPPPPPPPPPSPQTPQLSLGEIRDCIYPKGMGIDAGVWTLEVEYQVLANGQPVYGNAALASDGASTVSEKVTTTSGGPFIGAGVWCLATATCATPGTLTPTGTFWDVLAGNGTANQSFFINGQILKVSFPGSANGPTVLKNVYKSASQTVSVGSGALVGNSSTAKCESIHLGPTWH